MVVLFMSLSVMVEREKMNTLAEWRGGLARLFYKCPLSLSLSHTLTTRRRRAFSPYFSSPPWARLVVSSFVRVALSLLHLFMIDVGCFHFSCCSKSSILLSSRVEKFYYKIKKQIDKIYFYIYIHSVYSTLPSFN